MTSEQDYTAEGIERIPLKQFTEKAYLDYSMYVILDRALPQTGAAPYHLCDVRVGSVGGVKTQKIRADGR